MAFLDIRFTCEGHRRWRKVAAGSLRDPRPITEASMLKSIRRTALSRLRVDRWYVPVGKGAVAMFGILIRLVIQNNRCVKKLLALVSHPELLIGESGGGVMPEQAAGPARPARLDHQ